MIEWLKHIDAQFFQWINQGLSNPFFDILMPILRNRDTWILLYVALIVLILYVYKYKGIWIILGACIAVALSDQISSTLLKPWIERIRPCHLQALQTNVLIRCSSSFSFPSSHAANHFALAVFLGSIFYRLSKWPMYLGLIWASLICFAQVYVGVHFPLDILCGTCLGILVGLSVYFILTKYVNICNN